MENLELFIVVAKNLKIEQLKKIPKSTFNVLIIEKRFEEKELTMDIQEILFLNNFLILELANFTKENIEALVREKINSSQQYQLLSEKYEQLQQDIDYQKWQEFTMKFYKKGMKVVEGGAGTGTLAKILAFENYQCYDLSPEMVARGKNKNLDIYEGDIQDFKANDVDLYLVYLNTLNYLTKQQFKIAIANISQSLKVGGIFLLDIYSKQIQKEFSNYEYYEELEDFSYVHRAKIDDKSISHLLLFYDENYNQKFEFQRQYYHDEKEVQSIFEKNNLEVLTEEEKGIYHFYGLRRKK